MRSILACEYGDFEVIVVENRPDTSDTAATARMLATQFPAKPRVHCVEEPRRGASHARNAGLAHAKGEIVAFTDDDVIVDPGWIRASVDALARAEDIACVTGLILPLELETESQLLLEQFASFGKGFRRHTYRLPDACDENPLLPYAPGAIGSGASTVIRADVLRELGGFDPVLGPATFTTGGEDLDLYTRLLSAGYAVAYEPSAIVWHRHPDGMPRLRRQVYRYGVGFGATLAKQLITGPDRRGLIRAVPAGVRYARDPASRKNASKPNDCPRQFAWLELIGMLVGPLAYVLSALAALARYLAGSEGARSRPVRTVRRIVVRRGGTANVVWFEKRELPMPRLHRLRASPERITHRTPEIAVLGAAAACVTAPLFVALGFPTVLRMPAVLAFLCFAPGTAFLTAMRGRTEPGLVIGVSLGFAAVVAQSMLWLDAWWPRPFLYALAAVCLLPLASRLDLARRYRLTRSLTRDAQKRAVRSVKAISRTEAVHAALLCVSLLSWLLSLLGADLGRMSGIGLLSAMPVTFFLAFGLLIVGFAGAASSDQVEARVLGAYVLSLILVLFATTAVLYQEPRFAWVYKHFGVINLIAATGHANRQIDIYNNWPAFFAVNAWVSKTASVAPIAYAGWAQLFFNLIDLAAVRFALRGVTHDERLLWTAAFFFVLGNWVGQDYLAPQAFGFTLSLVVLGLCLRCGSPPRMRWRWNRRRTAAQTQALPHGAHLSRATQLPHTTPLRWENEDRALAAPLASKAALLAGGACFLAVVISHQLSPVLLILSVTALAVFVRVVPLWVPAVMAAIEVGWVVLAWPFVGTHFSLIEPGGEGAAAAGRDLSAALPGAALSFYAPAALMAMMAGLAVLGMARRLRTGKRDLVPICLIGAPLLGVGAQSYGGEGPYRAYLFALPWVALLAALACARSPVTGRPMRISLPRVLVVAPAAGVFLLFACFGQELANRISPDDVRAETWYEQHAPAGSLRIDLAPNAPDRLTARYPLVSLSDPPALLDQPGFTGHRLGTAEIPPLERLIRQQRAVRAYVVVSRGQEDYGLLNGLLPKGSVTNLVGALERSAAFRLVYQRPTAWVFEYVPYARSVSTVATPWIQSSFPAMTLGQVIKKFHSPDATAHYLFTKRFRPNGVAVNPNVASDFSNPAGQTWVYVGSSGSNSLPQRQYMIGKVG